MVLIGKRRQYIDIQLGTSVSDSQGGYTTTWASAGYEWGRAKTLNQSRVLDQGGIKYVTAVEFTVRKRSDLTITGAYRIVWGGNNYTIHSIVPSEKLDDQIILAYV